MAPNQPTDDGYYGFGAAGKASSRFRKKQKVASLREMYASPHAYDDGNSDRLHITVKKHVAHAVFSRRCEVGNTTTTN